MTFFISYRSRALPVEASSSSSKVSGSVDMENSSIFVEYWHGLFCYEKSTMEGEETFPMSEEGRLSMKAWLEERV